MKTMSSLRFSAAPQSLVFDISRVPDEPCARWFLKQGEILDTSRGFTSKESANAWIKSLGQWVDWQAGFLFRLRGDATDMSIVDRAGRRAQP